MAFEKERELERELEQDPRDRRLQFELRAISNLIKRNVDGEGVKDRIDHVTGMHGHVIMYLWENRHRDVFQKDVEEAFSYRRSTASSVISLMEEKGLITRSAVDHDARLKKLGLTERSLELVAIAEADINRVETLMKNGLSPQELELFFRVLDKIKNNLEK